jgi:hypothetical protein
MQARVPMDTVLTTEVFTILCPLERASPADPL